MGGELRRFLYQLVRRHDQLLDDRGVEHDAEQRHAKVDAEREHGGPGQTVGAGAPQHECATGQRRQSGEPEAGERGVEIREARSHQRSRRRVQQSRDSNEVHPQRRQQEQEGDQSGEVPPGRRLHGDAAPEQDDVPAQHVQRDGREQRNSREHRE